MEMIIKINSDFEDAEILFHDFLDNSTFEKKITIQKLESILRDFNSKNYKEYLDDNPKTKFLDPRIIGITKEEKYSIYLVNEPGHRRIVTYDYNGIFGGLKINFPSSIYEIIVAENEIKSIKAFMYLVYQGLNTKLYKYAMPNMLEKNSVCIGRAKREIDTNIFQTLENIIYAPYSHATLNNVKGFSNTEDYFKYLENNVIEEKYLHQANLTLKDIVEI